MALQNKLNITASAELAREEERISKKKAVELYDKGLLDSLEAGKFSALAGPYQWQWGEQCAFRPGTHRRKQCLVRRRGKQRAGRHGPCRRGKPGRSARSGRGGRKRISWRVNGTFGCLEQGVSQGDPGGPCRDGANGCDRAVGKTQGRSSVNNCVI